MKSLVKNPIMIDGRNALDRTAWRNAGWKFRALGVSEELEKK
jgi:UDPglucose 6-dehydrogenase